MSTCTIKETTDPVSLPFKGRCRWGWGRCFPVLFFLLFAGSALGIPPNEGELIPAFLVTDSSGEIRNSTDLFSGRHVVLVVTEESCSGLEPFLVWRKRLAQEKANQTLILCIGGTPVGAGSPRPLNTIWLAADDVTKALGITGTPMLLGIEENSIKWRIAGFMERWQGLAKSWLEVQK